MATSLTPITDKVVLDEYNNPKDAWKFGTDIQYSQESKNLSRDNSYILFNKGRYFEAQIYDRELQQEVAELAGLKIEYNMICANWRKLEEFVLAMNCVGLYANIKIDWV